MKNLIILRDYYKLKDGSSVDWQFYLNIKVSRNPISLDGVLTCFSNDIGGYSSLDKSIIVEFLSKEEAPRCMSYYENIKTNYLKYLNDTIKTIKQLDEYIYKLNNPITKYNYKLLNVFTFEELEYINNEIFMKFVLLDPNDFTRFVDQEFSSCYGYGIEIDTDLVDNDFLRILDISNDDYKVIVSAKETLEIMKKEKLKEDSLSQNQT